MCLLGAVLASAGVHVSGSCSLCPGLKLVLCMPAGRAACLCFCCTHRRVDLAIDNFKPYLDAVASSGQCDTVKEAGLLKLIAENSLLYTDVVTKIGLLDISQTAWKLDK